MRQMVLPVFLWVMILFCSDIVSAAEPEVTFALDVEGAELSGGEYIYRGASAGDTVTVRFSVIRTDAAESFSLFTMQNEIEFDMDFFTFVEGSITGKYSNADAVLQTRVRGQEIVKSSALGGPEYAAEQPFCEFQLKIKDNATGTGWVRCSNTAASNSGHAAVEITERNLTVSIGDSEIRPQYTVRFNANGGFMDASAPASVTVETGTEIPLPDASFSGYEFGGWSDGTRIYQGTYKNDNAESVTLTAVWERIKSSTGGNSGSGSGSNSGNSGGNSSGSGSGSSGSSSGGGSSGSTAPVSTGTENTPVTPVIPVTSVTPDSPSAAPDSLSDCPKDVTCPISAFSDLDPAAWYHDGLHFCLEQRIMNGLWNVRTAENYQPRTAGHDFMEQSR